MQFHYSVLIDEADIHFLSDHTTHDPCHEYSIKLEEQETTTFCLTKKK